MISNKNICMVYVSSKNRYKSVYDDYKKKSQNGVMYMKCPQSGEEQIIIYKNNKERLEWIELRNEIREELRMVS